jgi:hypothetical protein
MMKLKYFFLNFWKTKYLLPRKFMIVVKHIMATFAISGFMPKIATSVCSSSSPRPNEVRYTMKYLIISGR